MKKFAFILLSWVSVTTYAQQTISSVQNGNASNPFTWSCTCFPSTNDNIIINHTINMDVNWLVNNGGSITVNNTGSLIQTGNRSILIDGTNSKYLNYGNSGFYDVAYTNGGYGTNTGHFAVYRGMYVGTTSSYTNSGLLDGLDSLMTEGNFTNSGTLFGGNILNTGTFEQSGHLAGDSVGNTGTFTSTGGYMYFKAFGNSGTFTMNTSGFMDVQFNWFNLGTFNLENGTRIYAHSDFFNGDSIGGTAFLTNNAIIEVGNNFYNGYDINGSGNFCVSNDSYNWGNMSGTFDFCDNTGGGMDYNFGTIAGTITFCSTGCSVGVEESSKEENITVFPNPAQDKLEINSEEYFISGTILSLDGARVQTINFPGKIIDLTGLSQGSYLLLLQSENGVQYIKFLKY